MRIEWPVTILFSVCCVSNLSAQIRVPPEMLHERVIAVVPIVGAGTELDPKRPLFVPLPRLVWVKGRNRPVETGPQAGTIAKLISWSMIPSSDGRTALVEFVAQDRKDLSPILNAGRADVKAFVRGVNTKEEIEAEFQKLRPGFKLEQLVGHSASAASTAPAGVQP